MRKANINDMELGNLIFGNSRGDWQVEPREEYQDIFQQFLHDNGFDGYGISNNGDREFENDTFIIRSYYWGEDEKKAELPNFVYKPIGLEISWYKYPMRDAYSNMDMGINEFKFILNDCAESMKRSDNS